ncbi:MAG: maleylpyruvate isomerase N-terminal domain-containing protein [Desertimonas sp.]
MPTSLTEQRFVDVIVSSGAAMSSQARAAGVDAPVPTCPGWSVADLVAHATKVHRWSAGNLLGEPFERTDDEIIASEKDLIGYFDAGVDTIVAALGAASADGDAMVFLKDPPPTARHFWARRQAHETTIHGVDVLAALLGRAPTAAEVAAEFGVDTALALDGIDELVSGFFTRGRTKLALDEPYTVLVAPTDADRWWLLSVADERLSVITGDGAAPAADSVLGGSAVELYLGLWNRGAAIVESGAAGVLERWHGAQRVAWS